MKESFRCYGRKGRQAASHLKKTEVSRPCAYAQDKYKSSLFESRSYGAPL